MGSLALFASLLRIVQKDFIRLPIVVYPQIIALL
jgi:hypothetical protein